jgi:hypothetical protein
MTLLPGSRRKLCGLLFIAVELGFGCCLRFSWRGVLIQSLLPRGTQGPCSLLRSIDTSVDCLMTPFQLLSLVGSDCIPVRGRSHDRIVRPWGATRQNYWRLVLLLKTPDDLFY